MYAWNKRLRLPEINGIPVYAYLLWVICILLIIATFIVPLWLKLILGGVIAVLFFAGLVLTVFSERLVFLRLLFAGRGDANSNDIMIMDRE
ncbi:MAG: hypothetical protein OQK73_00155 [Gammaproteobacteria bacterium]|nr:hypothetical protein [Gammaproteobacteria bacterium]